MTLRCCALRPNAIWGNNEQRHLPRIADKVESGLTIFKFGSSVVLQDWCNVNNLVQVLLLLKIFPYKSCLGTFEGSGSIK